ncbi:hypothetical protein V5799_004215 [Amblyomma americanum]|uniref:Uncharacterized protein n=1 Tax=Amblyomma americanum TaxID=6943 RepID=A0AAQ4D6R5_AMBAM
MDNDDEVPYKAVRVVEQLTGTRVTTEEAGTSSAPSTMTSRAPSQPLNFILTESQEDDYWKSFSLPEFSFLPEGQDSPICSYVTRRIVDAVYQEMLKHTLYPSKKFFQNVGCSLVQRCPHLADTCGSGHVSILRCNL